MIPPLTHAQVIAQLNNISQAYITDIENHTADENENSDEKTGSNYPILKPCYNNKGSAAVKAI